MPLYEQIKDHIRARITGGQWIAGQKIASENELVRRLGASRMTVNRALRELTDEGILIREAGVGTFVAEAALKHPSSPIVEIREEITHRGHTYACEVMRHHCVDLDAEIAAALQRPIGSNGFHSQVAHFADGEAVMLEERWVNPLVVADYLDADLTLISPTQVLLDRAPLQRMEQNISARILDGNTTDILGLDEGTTALVVSRRTFSHDAVASICHLYYVAPEYVLYQGGDHLPAPRRTLKKEKG